MSKKRSFRLFPAYSNRTVLLAALLLTVYGSFMIVSAEMSRSVGDSTVILRSILKQLIYSGVGVAAMVVISHTDLLRLRRPLFKTGLIVITALLISTRLFGPLGGAYAWIHFGGFTIQPSEFAKLFEIAYFAKLLGRDEGRERNRKNFQHLILVGLMFFGIVVLIEKDFGSAIVLIGIAYVMLLVSRLPGCELYRRWMLLLFIAAIAGAVILLSPIGTAILTAILGEGDYRLGRFMASANPFLDPYNTGFHLIMGLVSFATGGWFGLGYGQSIHKFMNFPNPSSDFILPVIVEEMGVLFGFIPIVVLYALILLPLVRYSLHMRSERSRLVMVGVFMYFVLHFILNVGGVSGLIPLTGVPLLLLSSGGTSLIAALASVGLADSEIVRYNREKANAASDLR
ncbi:MAG: FtsW/RodA/SpoVE family cell cycle protein [Erysipelotrichaceae bacterium]|nr:FtsW/RodA/SpoVE family cell cycle protein [Erysipelotrichaceae bacterium]